MIPNRILVTGANGFIGRHVVAALLESGHALTLATRTERAIPDYWRDDPRIRLVIAGDLAVAALDRLLADVGTVVHLAGLAGLPGVAESQAAPMFMLANADTTEKLAAAARAASVGAFIHLSSIMAITANIVPGAIDDMVSPQPATPYGRSKLEAERHVHALAAAGILAISLRPPLVIGAEAKGNWRSLQKLAASGLPLPFASIHNARSLISAASLAEAIVKLCQQAWPAGLSGAYAIADPEPVSLPAILTELRSGMGLPPRLLPCSPSILELVARLAGRQHEFASLAGSLRLDPSRFHAAFSYLPMLPLTEAIRLSGKAFLATTRSGRAR